MRDKSLFVIPMVILLSLLFGCANPLAPTGRAGDLSEAKRVSESGLGPLGSRYEKGVLGPGAEYEIWIPPAVAIPPMMPWNHCLVIYAHGYVNPSQPVALTSDPEALLTVFLANGFAVAHSSYSENGWAVKDGAIRTRQLRGYFASAYGPLVKVYLIGASEGAMISIMLAEKNPELFSGVLCIGGPLGGADMEVKYIYNIRILFDRFFKDELAVVAGLVDVPSPQVPPQYIPLIPLAPRAKALQEALGPSALMAHPTGSLELDPEGVGFVKDMVPLLLALFQLSPPTKPEAIWMATTYVIEGSQTMPIFNWPTEMLGTPYFFTELAATIAGGLWYNIFGTEDILSRTHGHVPIDNTKSCYVVGTTGEILIVERLTSRPDARNYLEHWYQTTGKLAIPVFVLHTERDPIVPVAHAYAYYQLAAASGNIFPDVIRDVFGHCQILVPPEYNADVTQFGDRVITDFSQLLQLTGMPKLWVPPQP